jgi:inward rectifier potassium channel
VAACLAPPATSASRRRPRRGLDESLWTRFTTDAFHFLRSTSWTQLTLFFLALYFAINLFFGAVLYFGDARILNAQPGFVDRFVFSVQTMATIGYGFLAPDDWLSHSVVTVQSFVSIMFNAMVTGVFFSKFSTPSAKVMWSRTAVVADEDGVPTLMFRCANARKTALVEATINVAITRDEVLSHGESVRRIYDLQLRRRTSPMFALSWTVYHRIDANSPLYGRTPEQIEAEQMNFIATLTAIDDSLAATVHARHIYEWHRIQWNHRFRDIIVHNPDGSRSFDYSGFHDTFPVSPANPDVDHAAPR